MGRPLLVFIALASLSLAPLCRGAEPARIKLGAGQSRVIEIDHPTKVLIGNKEVADVGLVSSNEVLINAKSRGETSLIIWTPGGEQHAYQILVGAGGLEKTMIEMDVHVVELTDADNWDLGLDYARLALPNASVPAGLPNQPNQLLEQTTPPLLSFGTFNRGPIDVVINALVSHNHGKILAKPRLLTVSGANATFLAGGEVPVVNQDALGKTNVEYKNYGVTLDIQPTADDNGNVNAVIRVEVSNLDSANSVKVGNGLLPALKTRWVKTSLFVKENGTLVIAGLIQEEEGKVTTGIPLISEIPFLGELFKSTHIVTKRSELVVFVTPKVLG